MPDRQEYEKNVIRDIIEPFRRRALSDIDLETDLLARYERARQVMDSILKECARYSMFSNITAETLKNWHDFAHDELPTPTAWANRISGEAE
jgi:hypothetical protein